jgi:hypothetical protein
MPAGGEDTARCFYSGVLGVPEVPKPGELAKRGGKPRRIKSGSFWIGATGLGRSDGANRFRHVKLDREAVPIVFTP